MMTLIEPAVRTSSSFVELRDQGRAAAEAGHLEHALCLFDEAMGAAEREGDPNLVDLAYGNRSAILINLGRHQEVIPGLREILVRNASSENCFLAAYNLSRAYNRGKEFKKGLFYARISQDRAQALDREDWLAGSSNQIGNCLLNESYFEEAETEYRRALSLGIDADSVASTMLLANLGYCLMILERCEEGIELVLDSLQRVRERGATLYEAWPHLFLCYGYQEIGQLLKARSHGRKALRFAERAGDPELTKNSLYMLGETEKLAGDTNTAYDYYSTIQARFYPGSPEVLGFMVAVDMRQMVNLTA